MVYAAHVPLRFLCLNDRKRRHLTFQKKHSIAVGLWARPPVLSHSLVTRKGILRLDEIALHAVRLDRRRQRGNLILCCCDEWRTVALAVVFVSFLGGGEISGHVILQLLQNTNDLAPPRCVTSQIAELPALSHKTAGSAFV